MLTKLQRSFYICPIRQREKGSSRICGKRCVDGNQTILVWHALSSLRRHIRDLGPELEALVTFTAPHKSAMNREKVDLPADVLPDFSSRLVKGFVFPELTTFYAFFHPSPLPVGHFLAWSRENVPSSLNATRLTSLGSVGSSKYGDVREGNTGRGISAGSRFAGQTETFRRWFPRPGKREVKRMEIKNTVCFASVNVETSKP